MAETKQTGPGRHANLAEALAAFQAEVPVVAKSNQANVKTKDGSSYKYQYAALDDITPIVLPLLGKHGLAWSTRPTLMGQDFALQYALTHESGESLEGVYPLPPASTAPQALGSAITYARRYALCAVTGVAPGGDDDDAQNAPAAAARRPASDRNQPPVFAAERRRPSRDWDSLARQCASVDQLRALDAEAERLGERGLKMHADEGAPTVGQLIRFRAEQLRRQEPAADPGTGEVAAEPEDAAKAAEPAAEWEAREPGSGVAAADPGDAL